MALLSNSCVVLGKSVISLDPRFFVYKTGFILMFMLESVGDLNEIMHLEALCKL